MRIAVAANSGWYLYNFRRSLMLALRDAGHRPVAISPHDEYIERLVQDGIDFIDFALDASGTNPFSEFTTVRRLRKLLIGGKFDAAFTYTPKANIYFGLAAKGMGLQHIPNVSGLGRVFIARSWLTPLVMQLYRRAFASARVVIFQNADDEQEFIENGLVSEGRTARVPGSGVDLFEFSPAPYDTAEGDETESLIFLFIGRILRDKGVLELVEAARLVKAKYPNTRFRMLGSIGAQNPTAIPQADVDSWIAEGLIDYLGSTDDVRPAIAAADCVVLPSYREGVPRVLLEAAAMARPCIATDVPGCRDAVDRDSTGLFCDVGSAASLAAALLKFIAMPKSRRRDLGRLGRAKVVREFDERVVLRTYVSLATEIDGEQTAARQGRAA